MAEAGEWRAAKRRRFTSNIVALRVGPTADILTVHESLIKQGSPFFSAALDKKWKEGNTREIDLPEDETEIVTAYLDWQYNDARKVDTYEDEAGQPDHYFVMKLYCFGEKVLNDVYYDRIILYLANSIDKQADRGKCSIPGSKSVCAIYSGTSKGSPARQFLVHLYATLGTPGFLEKKREQYCAEFLGDLAIECLKKRTALVQRGLVSQSSQWFKLERTGKA